MQRRLTNSLLIGGVVALCLSFQLVAQFARVPSQQYPSQPQIPNGQPAYPQSGQYPQVQPGQPYPGPNPSGAYNPDPNAPDQEDAALDQQHSAVRISVVQGDVNIRRGDTGDFVAAAVNAPLMAQDHLQTSAGSRAEIQLDAVHAIRVAPDTDLALSSAAYQNYQAQLGAGTVIVRVLRPSQTQFELDTPSIAARPADPGEYRISVLPDGNTQITVREGSLEIFSPRGNQRIAANQSVLIRGNPSDPEFQNTYVPGRDQFDDWSATRDRELLSSQSYQYVSPDIAGAQDLDAYGSWVPSQYGPVWAPQSAPPDWSPYSSGQWAWENFYGWTWVDSTPWGWAPYHYGRWFWNGGRGWCWWPGPVRSSYFWRPALVGFFGWGRGVGWVPLAPYEPFHGWWGRGYWRDGLGWHGGYGNRFGFVRNVEVARLYRNAAVRGGALTAGFDRFGGPGQRFSFANRAQLVNASRFVGAVPVSPTRASFQFANRTAFANPRLSSVANRQFYHVGASRPPAAFTAGQRGPASAEQRNSRTGPHPAPQQHSGSGWQRFGAPEQGQSFAERSRENGWHRFGQPQPGRNSYTAPSRPWTFPQGSWGSPNNRPQQSPPAFGFGGRGNSGGNFRNDNPAPTPRLSAPVPRFEGPRNSSPSRSYQGGRSDGGNRGGGGGSRGSGGGHSGGGGHRGH
jgi:hypothetical protein